MCFLIFLILSVVLSFGKWKSTASPVGKILMDVDVGNDDAWALLMATSGYAQKELGVDLIGITCVQGNTEIDHVVINVLKVLKTVNRLDIPVYKGADKSIIYTPPGDNYYGKDGFGDFDFPDPPNPDDYLQKEHAVNAMIRIVNQYPGEVTLIALGPLTNVALAVRMDSGFLNKLKKLVVLGGSVKGVGNMMPGIEFNFYVDPHAARIVFNSTQSPICVFSWEFAKASSLPINWRINVLGQLDNQKVSLMNKAEHIANYTKDYWLIADGFTTSAILQPDLVVGSYETSECGGQKLYVRVETDGFYTKGLMTVDYADMLKREPNAEIVDRIDKDKFMEFLLKCME